jgi:hypothetical protein
MKFELSEAEVARVRAWSAEQDAVVVERQRQEIAEGKFPNAFAVALNANGIAYYGAIGGALTYSFTPNLIGEVITVKHGGTGAELDLTDYENW